MVPVDPDNSLAQRLAELGNISEYSTQLSSGKQVGELFPEPYSHKHLHVVVQCADIVLSSLSGEYCWLIVHVRAELMILLNFSPHLHICFNCPPRSYLNRAFCIYFPPLSLSQPLGSDYGLQLMRMDRQQSEKGLVCLCWTQRPAVPLSTKQSKRCRKRTCQILQPSRTFLFLHHSQCLTNALYPIKSTTLLTLNTWGGLSFMN